MRPIDADEVKKRFPIMENDFGMVINETLHKELDKIPPLEAIPKEEVRQFIKSIQMIKDNHNEHGEPINYGTICGILIEGYRLLDKYGKDKDGNDD